MKVRNIIRKAAVLGAGASMVGATIMGAVAYDLADYPDQYIVDGEFNGKIVVGEEAATSDVLGAIDIAASLQAGSVVEEEVDVPGLAGEVSLSGDAFRLETSNDLLEIRETVGAVYDTLTDSELDALEGGSITTDQGNTDYNQYLRFGDNAASALEEMYVGYVENDANELGDYLVIDDDEPFFEWEIEFTEGLESEMSGSPLELEDLEDETFNIFGTEYTFVDSSIVTTSGSESVTLEFMAGQVADTLREGETKTYTIDGVDYEVTAVFISDPNSGTPEAKFAVNGELTDGMEDGDTDTLSGGLEIGVRDLLVNSREGVVEFFLGAEKVEFTDDWATADSDGDVEIGNERIEDASVDITGQVVGTDNFEITSIKYKLTADAAEGSTIYVPENAGVRQFLDEPEGMLSTTFDIRYEGLKEVDTEPLMLESVSDHSYEFTAANLRGKVYDDVPVLTAKDGNLYWGDDDDDFWFTEPAAPVGGDANLSASHFWIGDDDYFVLAEDATATEKTDTAIMRYDDIDTSDQIITFEDMSTGQERRVTYTTTSSFGTAVGVATNFVVEGQSYTVYVTNTTGYPLAIDLDASGSIDGGEANFVALGGGIVDFGTQTDFSGRSGWSSPVTMSLSIPADQYDDRSTAETIAWNITESSSEVGISSPTNLTVSGFELINDDSDDDYDRGMLDYGALVELFDPSGDDAEELTIYMPEAQVGAQVFVVAGSVERSAGGAGGVTREVVNPIAVGLAVLDVDADGMLGSENLIIVGGPCANTVAAEFLGNPSDCAEGFEPGRAMIVSQESGENVAILVAGYEAQETLGASYVLADYSTYLSDVEGSEVEVVASDLSDLSVMVPSEEADIVVAEDEE